MEIVQPYKLPFLEFLGWQIADVYRSLPIVHEWFVIEPDPIFSIDPRSGSEIDPLKDNILAEHDIILPIEGIS